MNRNFSRSKNLHESSKLEHFRWERRAQIWRRGELQILDVSKNFRTIITFPAFWAGSENLPNRLEMKYGDIG